MKLYVSLFRSHAMCLLFISFTVFWLFSIRRPGGNFFRSFYTATLCFGWTLFVFPEASNPWVVTNSRCLVSSNGSNILQLKVFTKRNNGGNLPKGCCEDAQLVSSVPGSTTYVQYPWCIKCTLPL